ncbi:MAG: oxygen-independent coproporphyrinogen III oxidase [Alphaproteobacteria bacterium]|nr:oxygen-independent coproporphyrinogen III oxidase [Alphaproteobacteria bacterium]
MAARYDKPVPRYTSYPTAPHFHDGVNADTYRRWLAQLPAEDALSLYLHVPFCAKMCWYCGCHTKIVGQYSPIADYAGTLEREIRLVADIIGRRARVAHVHWGGGTPTILAADDFRRLMGLLNERFEILPNAEIAVEADPRTLDDGRITALARSGVNRASLGIQDLNTHVQEAINRVQPFEQVKTAVEKLRDTGIQAFNADLMYGLPYQTTDDVRRTVEMIATLSPSRLAVFGYAHVPWMKTHQKMIPDAALPGGTERLAQARTATDELVARGFRAIGLDHFAAPGDALARALDTGRLKRNFQGYTDDSAAVLAGFGASAIGQFPEGYVQNAVPFHLYDEAIAAERFATSRGLILTPEDRLRRAVIEKLMCEMHVDLGQMARAHGFPDDTFDADIAQLGPLAADGIVAVSGATVRIPEEGRLLMRTVAAVFDRYLQTGRGRHSRAV